MKIYTELDVLQKSINIPENYLMSKIQTRDAKIAVIGIGYVGLSLAVHLARHGFIVITWDEDQSRNEFIRKGKSYIDDIPSNDIEKLIEQKKLFVSSDESILSEADCIIICVPTPLSTNREPDLSYISRITDSLSRYLRSGQLIVLESTTYPGTCEEMILPKLQLSGLEVGRDFYLAHSPERIDFGNNSYNRYDAPKVVGGLTAMCTEVACTLYSHAFKVIPVTSAKVAEMVKVFENTYRLINTALVNEITLLCDRMNINVWEMLDAAFTKPYGIQAFYPGPGVGGHCIPIDPFYLSWKAREFDFSVRMIELAGEINAQMPSYVVSKSIYALGTMNKPLNGANIVLIGVAYKKDIKDYRESPALKIINLLQNAGANVSYFDPLFPKIESKYIKNGTLYSVELSDSVLKQNDLVIIVTDHSTINYERITKEAKLIIDTRNATKGIMNRENVILI
ncbi:nucleotide sugar dehydrogenase [Paenibacillus sp. MZ04-78.2]|uniref:nucleotide sugar dehydrogenase n=1 Tax=Paenibacillus sp. MZ04-78.2 TaxID=2962034 RepID=UPI0020B70439|nr:nucleotide sugar dehydrogenase [Paenibacillus sp. MZ04-78.2]MCP3776511.1 nucleotide sugar dehydrogenase [Paenibacillus sp. MZ04-78.2]